LKNKDIYGAIFARARDVLMRSTSDQGGRLDTSDEPQLGDENNNHDRLTEIWERKAGGCSGKKRFNRYDIPWQISQDYNERVALQFGSFGPYWCRHHDAWHVGHKGRKQAVLQVIRNSRNRT
jgi:hypothetical protein